MVPPSGPAQEGRVSEDSTDWSAGRKDHVMKEFKVERQIAIRVEGKNTQVGNVWPSLSPTSQSRDLESVYVQGNWGLPGSLLSTKLLGQFCTPPAGWKSSVRAGHENHLENPSRNRWRSEPASR